MKCQNSCYENVSIVKNCTSPQFLLIQYTAKMNSKYTAKMNSKEIQKLINF